jgi:hypothetical protein
MYSIVLGSRSQIATRRGKRRIEDTVEVQCSMIPVPALGQEMRRRGVYEFLIASLPRRLRNGRFNSNAAVRRFQKLNRHLDPDVV